MIKKIITLVVCLALCVSCIAVGVINQKADDADIATAANGTIEGISAAPEGATLVGGELYKKDSVYYLNSDVTITRENAASNPTYLALLDIDNLDIEADAEGAYTAPTTTITLGGNGNTITTEIPLFDVIGNVIVKNLNVIADNSVSDEKVTPIELTDADVLAYGTKYRVGAIAAVSLGNVNFNNVTVNGGLTYDGNSENGVRDYKVMALGGFVGALESGTETYTNCVNNANVTLTIKEGATIGAGDNDKDRLAAGGFLGLEYPSYDNTVTFASCLNTGDVVGSSPYEEQVVILRLLRPIALILGMLPLL